MTPCEHGAGGGPDHRDVLKWPGAHSGGLGPALCVTSAESVALDGADVCPQPPQVTAWSRTSASAFPRSHTPRLKSHGEASVAKPEGFPNRPGPLEAPERGYTEPSTPVSQTRGGSGGVWENGRASVGETGLTPDLRRLPPHRVPAPCPRRCWLPLRLLCYPAKISGPSMPETKPVKDGSKLPDCPGRKDRYLCLERKRAEEAGGDEIGGRREAVNSLPEAKTICRSNAWISPPQSPSLRCSPLPLGQSTHSPQTHKRKQPRSAALRHNLRLASANQDLLRSRQSLMALCNQDLRSGQSLIH